MECKKLSDHVYLTNLFKKYTKKNISVHKSLVGPLWIKIEFQSYPKLIRIDTIRWWKKYGAPACMDKLLKLSSHIYAKRPPFLMGQIRVWTTYTDYGLDYRFSPPALSAAYKLFTSRIPSYSKHRSILHSAHGIESTYLFVTEVSTIQFSYLARILAVYEYSTMSSMQGRLDLFISPKAARH